MRTTLIALVSLIFNSTLFAQTEEFEVTKVKDKTYDYKLGTEVYHSEMFYRRKGETRLCLFQYKGWEMQLDLIKSNQAVLRTGTDTVARWDFNKSFSIGQHKYRINRNGTKVWTFERDKKPVLEGRIESRNGKKYYVYKMLTDEDTEQLELMSFNQAHAALVKRSGAPIALGLAVMLGVMQFAANR